MYANMPKDSFMLYIVFFWVQFFIVIGYGVFWYFKGRKIN